MYIVRQSTAVTIVLGPFVDATDGVTAETSLTIAQADVRLSKNGGAFAQRSASGNLSHMENGNYALPLSTTDTNTVGTLRVHVNESGALPVWESLQVVEEDVYDALFAASATGLLPANVTQFGGVAGTFSSGRPEVNTSHWGGTAVASANVLIDGAITASKLASAALTSSKIEDGALTAEKFAAGAFDAAWSFVYEGSESVLQGLRLFRAALVGKLNGAATTTINMRDAADSKNRITATVDEDGNRTAVSTDTS